MPWSKWASTPRTFKRLMASCGRATRLQERSVRRGSSRCNRRGSQAPTPLSSFEPGLFVGGEAADFPADNLDLERWFKGPKGHERRIHGHRHAGVRIVWQGPTLMLALDAHVHQDGPFTVGDLEPYSHARVPESQQQAVERGKLMRQARSRKKRPVLLADLEKRYLNVP